MKLIKFVSLIILITTLCSCNSLTTPRPYGIDNGLVEGAPPGSPGFRYGWKDGCESGMAAYGSLHYKISYGFKYDRTALHNDEYHKAWEMGFRHCRWYTAAWVK
ncbi:MAG: hypothetical protein AAF195_04675 [Pseudomonadota bacterium]